MAASQDLVCQPVTSQSGHEGPSDPALGEVARRVSEHVPGVGEGEEGEDV